MLQKSTFDFLKQLKRNNNREWFQKNKSRYEAAHSDFLSCVNDLIPAIAKFDSGVAGLRAKDCVFRIYRDVRFSKDKSPYKAHFSAYFSRGGRKSFIPGYYIHIQPGESFAAGGVWRPPSEILNLIRQEIDYNGKEFKGIIHDKIFVKYFGGLENEKLKTTPKNYSRSHPNIELLKYTSYIVSHDFSDKEVMNKNFIQNCTKIFRAILPLNKFLNTATSEAKETIST